jgi:hypothetical protein
MPLIIPNAHNHDIVVFEDINQGFVAIVVIFVNGDREYSRK